MLKYHPSAYRPRRQIALIEGLEERRLLSSVLGDIFSDVRSLIFGTPSGGDFHFGQHQFVVGTIVSTDTTANTITISDPVKGIGTSTTYTLASNAKITADGSTVTLASLLTGAKVSLQLSTSGSTTTVTAINAINQHVAGTISSIDTTANTITVTGFDGANTTYPVASNATIKLDDSSSTLGGLAANDLVQLTLSALDGKTATEIDATSLSVFGRGGHHGGHHMSVTVVSVDTTADTITVSTPNRGSTTQTTYTVDSGATITADGATTTLGALLAGAQVQLTVSLTSSTTVTAIAASSQHVAGSVSAVDTTADTITIARQNGMTSTYPVGGAAAITVNASAGTLAAVATGSLAQVTLSAFDDKTVTSIVDRTAVLLPGKSHSIHATVVSVDAAANTITALTLLRGNSTQTTYTVDPVATITANGTAVSLAGFIAGAGVTLTLSASSATTVTSIAAVSPIVSGLVTAVDATADTITIGSRGGAPTTYPVNSTATISLDGAASTLGAIIAGTRATLTLSALDGKTVTSIQATTPATIVHHRRALGTVTGVDAAADTITITSFFEGSATPTTYTLGPAAIITANGATASLASLSAGANVILQLTTIATTTTVTSIAALPQHSGGVIVSVDMMANTITIAPNNGGAEQTFPIGSSATVSLNGAATTPAALVAGLHVQLQLSALDGKTVLSIRANGQSH